MANLKNQKHNGSSRNQSKAAKPDIPAVSAHWIAVVPCYRSESPRHRLVTNYHWSQMQPLQSHDKALVHKQRLLKYTTAGWSQYVRTSEQDVKEQQGLNMDTMNQELRGQEERSFWNQGSFKGLCCGMYSRRVSFLSTLALLSKHGERQRVDSGSIAHQERHQCHPVGQQKVHEICMTPKERRKKTGLRLKS